MEKTPTIPLIKMSDTYKMVIPAKVEKQIRFLCGRSWNTEWSGVLFYTYSGSFENNDLVVTCEDIFPMDIGSAGYTEFNMSPDVIGYMAQNPELLDCKMGLIHSHNTMATFFSGTDTGTLKEVGAERNHFVSLIVNNAGKYTAAITRKIKYKQVRSFVYDSFEGEVSVEDPTVYEGEEIEYFYFDIEKEEVIDDMKDLSDRFDEIQKKKASAASTSKYFIQSPSPTAYCYSKGNKLNASPVKISTPFKASTSYPSLFDQPLADGSHAIDDDDVNPSFTYNGLDEETKREIMEWNRSFGIDTPEEKKEFSSDKVQSIVAQLVTGGVLVTDYSKVKDPKWLNTMTVGFTNRFGKGAEGDAMFKLWAEDFLQFLIWYSIDDDSTNPDFEAGCLAEAVVNELQKLPKNRFIDMYIKMLENYYV